MAAAGARDEMEVDERKREVDVDARHLIVYAWRFIPVMLVVGLAAQLGYRETESDSARKLIHVLLLDSEGTLPAFVSGLALLAAALVLMVGSRTQRVRGLANRWRVLAVVMAGLALDEVVGLHEVLDEGLTDAAGFTDPSRPLWVVGAVVFVGAVVLWMLPLLSSLAPRHRWRWILAGAVFCSGAVVVEVIAHPWYAPAAEADLGYLLLVVLEEGLELVGATMFLSAIIGEISERAAAVRVGLAD